jgi:hypothetical protein
MDCFGRDDIGKVEKLCNREGRGRKESEEKGTRIRCDGVVKRALHRDKFRHNHKRIFLTVV